MGNCLSDDDKEIECLKAQLKLANQTVSVLKEENCRLRGINSELTVKIHKLQTDICSLAHEYEEESKVI